MNDNVRKHKIIIIGAGIAGLSAANHLIKNGFTDLKIIEARNRIGERRNTSSLAFKCFNLLDLCFY
jgi:monoamine oxidase